MPATSILTNCPAVDRNAPTYHSYPSCRLRSLRTKKPPPSCQASDRPRGSGRERLRRHRLARAAGAVAQAGRLVQAQAVAPLDSGPLDSGTLDSGPFFPPLFFLLHQLLFLSGGLRLLPPLFAELRRPVRLREQLFPFRKRLDGPAQQLWPVRAPGRATQGKRRRQAPAVSSRRLRLPIFFRPGPRSQQQTNRLCHNSSGLHRHLYSVQRACVLACDSYHSLCPGAGRSSHLYLVNTWIELDRRSPVITCLRHSLIAHKDGAG